MGTAMLGSLESGFIFALMALGVYLTFRILDFPDLTVDGSFTTGGSVAAVLIVSGYPPLIATALAVVAGFFFGAITGVLHTKGKINALLSGILSMIALYSINLRIMGKANIGLLGQETLISQISAWTGSMKYSILIVVAILAIIVKVALDWFLRTEIGMALRATGDNPRMIRSFSANTDNTIIIGLALSNGLVALSGALMAQYQGFSDVSMGIGMIIIGLASVIIGEAIFGSRSIWRATFAVVGGAVIYRLVVAAALRFKFVEASDMKLITALIVIAALIAPKMINNMKEKKRKAARRKQMIKANASLGGEKNAEA
ncbi:ABC transporter permease [Ammoniphilus oxalaticus]|uniref:ABC transporter permease n=1 Tax=Ammoniphilus oxalaticus TaxID=66863 RepID=A0A419SRE3_9BACL|nr:ABC transporter permease [Ammoniphilus oxalaticus]RKD27069.1 ABC transporter permease [Ammoniphilus oxalaticus]